MPVAEPAKRVLFLGAFRYQLSGTVKMNMKGLLACDESSGLGASGMKIEIVLDIIGPSHHRYCTDDVMGGSAAFSRTIFFLTKLLLLSR